LISAQFTQRTAPCSAVDKEQAVAATAEITKDQLVQLRDTEQQSWAKVAEALGLGSPGAARRAYTQHVRPHNESVLASHTNSGAVITPVHLADATLAKVRDAIVGRTIIVQRKDTTEKINVVKVTSVKDGTVNFNDGDKSRSVKSAAIVAVK
jgi:hypothetical protein